MNRPRRVRVGSVNLRWGMSRPALTAAGRKIAGRLDVVGFQELRSPLARKAVRRGLRTRSRFGWREGGSCPQAFDKATLEVVRGSRRWLQAVTPGKRGVTPTLPILRVAYRHRRDPAIRFVVYSTHMVPLIRPDHPRSDHPEWRREHWDAHWETLCQHVHRDVEDGWTVFLVADINNVAAPDGKIGDLHATARWLHRARLDWVVLAGEGRSCGVRRLRRIRFRTGADHRAAGVSLLLTAGHGELGLDGSETAPGQTEGVAPTRGDP